MMSVRVGTHFRRLHLSVVQHHCSETQADTVDCRGMTLPGEIHYKSKRIPSHDLMDNEIVPLRPAVPQPAINGR